jgi:peptide/nickel transport system substrate-binding protein
MRRALAWGLGVVLFLGLVGGAGAYLFYLVTASVVPAAGGTYSEAIVGPVGGLNPIFAEGDENARDLASLIFEGLTRIDPGGEVTGALAQSWEVSADQKSYRFQLRPGARWADGRPVEAEDVQFTIRLVQDPAYQGTFLPGTWRNVQAAVETPDRIDLTLPAPSAAFLANAALLPILPRHAFSGTSVADVKAHPFNERPYGSGPFRVTQRDGEGITLERSRAARLTPLLERVRFRIYPSVEAAAAALEGKAVDALAEPPPRFTVGRNPRLRVYTAQTYQYTALLFNLRADVPYFQDRRVRRAVAMAINRQRLIAEVLARQATPADGPIPAAIAWAVNPEVHGEAYDPIEARRLLTEAGWPEPATGGTRANAAGKAFEISLVAGQEGGVLATVAQGIADDLMHVGIEAKVVPVNAAELLRKYLKPRTFELALVAFDNGPDPDVFILWHSSAASGTGFNFVSMRRNAFIDRDLEEGRATSDRLARRAAYLDFQRLLADELPAVFLYSPRFSYVVDRRVHGIVLKAAVEPYQRFDSIARWYVATRRQR